ncbi:MAG: CIA30 family protein [Planctomycetota bacterium]
MHSPLPYVRRYLVQAIPTIALMIGLSTTAQAGASGETIEPEAEPVTMRLTDFTNPEHNARWYPLLDNVMGGRSLGTLKIADGVLAFTGSINTNGGGFASIRLPVAAGTFTGATHVSLRLRVPDTPQLRDRGPFRMILIDDLHTLPRDHPDRRSRRITHRIDLPLDPTLAGQWQTVSVPLAGFTPSWRGRSMPNEAAINPDRTVELGLILNDATDGPFHLDVDAIDLHMPGP